ncbi:MAG: hypothetical protein NTW29_19815 [Bacteroidetes bacterium]|nr:hypothetical protein [Bacteroidota bacterium]
MKLIFVILCFLSVTTYGQTIRFRDYKKGEQFTYRLTTDVYRNDKFTSQSVSVSHHVVVKTGRFFSEKVNWLNKMIISGKDTVRLDSIAQQIEPYNISLSPKGKVLLPKLTVPAMTGEITDLNTFYVAIAPALNAQQLTAQTPVFMNEKLRKGNFADSIEVLYGTDCLQVTQKLIERNKEYVVVETDFSPPPSLCITPLMDTVGKKTFEKFNNIQFIREGDGNKVNVFWGVESFKITTKVNNTTGQILEATMTNLLNLRMRYGSSSDMKTYTVEITVTIKMVLKIELVN